MLLTVAAAAEAAKTAVAILIDEVQYLSEVDFSALIVALHKAEQKGLPLIFFGAGLPQVAGLAGDAKSYTERLFEFPEVGKLSRDAARSAIRTPVRREGADITDEALEMIIKETEGYPYFLQEWGSKAWNAAPSSPITPRDARQATSDALEQLDHGFFRVRLDRLTSREKEYVRAMVELGPGPHRSGEIAKVLGMDVTSAGPLRNGIVSKGMIYSKQHGETDFTVPMFDAYMRRSMPDWKPTAPTRPPAKRGRKPGK